MSEIVIGHLYTFPSIIYACQAQKRDNHRRYFVNDDASSQGATTVQMLGDEWPKARSRGLRSGVPLPRGSNTKSAVTVSEACVRSDHWTDFDG